jgi:Ca-activated chloride channel homolog
VRLSWIVCGLLIGALFADARRMDSQTNAVVDQDAQTYRLSVSVDEVILTFHAADVQGLSSDDLKLNDLKLLDDGKPPRKILDFKLLQDFPVRAGILVDTSLSMRKQLPGDRAIAIQYAQKLLRQETDKAFVTKFGRVAKVVQPWTSDPMALTAGIREVTEGVGDPISGTAIFDAIFRTCLYQFGKIDHAASGNFILLFSDGEDNASYVYLKDAVDMCQRSNTAIYTFRASQRSGSDSGGTPILVELAQETGGRIFADDGSEAEIYNDLRTIEADVRNRYRLIYRPAELKHDGSFHHVELKAPERFDTITVRSGYYAPAH